MSDNEQGQGDLSDPAVIALVQAFERWRTQPPVIIHIPRREGYILIGMLQLLTREGSPIWAGGREVAERIGRQLQEGIADTVEIYTQIETGWHPELDVPQEEK